ncbi:type II 3-dehydroquinate dehydratase, partial [Gordonia sp. (in: high G+C Gram-positive bacteria)]|uniref:type II 3-dehydroquinate dehydratase n=1 Tax=Gordonia sp. (in: high G+C Gram-positive bacteria) TaxID=84139 RepID=UPI00169BFD47
MSTTASPALPILLLNGPNLNTLGVRQPEVYGSDTLDDVVALVERTAAERGLSVIALQTNHEGEMIDAIHAARGTVGGIVINPGGWTHTSVALADALVVPEVPIIEVHISNVHAREAFRHHSYISPIAAGVIAGCGIDGYA